MADETTVTRHLLGLQRARAHPPARLTQSPGREAHRHGALFSILGILEFLGNFFASIQSCKTGQVQVGCNVITCS